MFVPTRHPPADPSLYSCVVVRRLARRDSNAGREFNTKARRGSGSPTSAAFSLVAPPSSATSSHAQLYRPLASPRGCNIAGEVISRLARSRRAQFRERFAQRTGSIHEATASEHGKGPPFVASFLRVKNSRQVSRPATSQATHEYCEGARYRNAKRRPPKETPRRSRAGWRAVRYGATGSGFTPLRLAVSQPSSTPVGPSLVFTILNSTRRFFSHASSLCAGSSGQYSP
jgi:hypothetical protein